LAWRDELVWREFFVSIMFHFPRVLRGSFRPEYDSIAWRDDEADFESWRQGLTGYPIVDAGMRQLDATGWMHNRVRMIVASFLVKDLLVDWRRGERHFMLHLVDGDPAANNGGWQWTAGTGTDAAPFFRVFNPTLQARKFDPGGAYVRRWVPELANVADEHVHAPWRMPAEAQRRAGCVLERDYPAPVVDHRAARERALAAYRRAKARAGAKAKAKTEG
jgi:deoxyribodipyrimidine photo-lyase